MAIAHDAVSQHSTLDTASFTADTSWTHTPVGTPKGVVVAITQPLASGDQVVGVTYGGVALARVRSQARTVTEQMRVYLYFLGSGIPTGAQTVAVTVGGVGTAAKHGFCLTMTAAAGMDTIVDADNGADLGIIANPSLTVTHTGTLTGWAGYAAHGYGGAAVVTTGLQTGETYRGGHDPGAAVGMIYSRHGGAAAASSTYGYTTLTSDDQLIAAVVVKEVAPPLGLSGTSTTTTSGVGSVTTVPPAKWSDSLYDWDESGRNWVGWEAEHRSRTTTESLANLNLAMPLVTAIGFASPDIIEDNFEAPTVTSGLLDLEIDLGGSSVTTTSGNADLGILAGPEDAPDAILLMNNLQGTVTQLWDSPTAPDAEWLVATEEQGVTDLKVSFPTPTTAPGSGGPVRFQVLVRKTAVVGATDPQCVLELWENISGTSTFVQTLSTTTITSATGQVLEVTFNPAVLTTASGANVELRVRRA